MTTKNENVVVVDDWECIDDSELNTKVSQIKKNATNSQTNSNAGNECSRAFSTMLLSDDDDCLRTNYVPPEPTVKILKRPTNDKNNQQMLSDQKPKAPIKTLQQREQEYAEARLRILGSAKSEEDEEANLSVSEKNGMLNANTNGYTTQTNSVGSSTRAYVTRSPQNQQQQPHQLPSQTVPEMRLDNNVIRLPRGPGEKSSGFMLKR